MKPPAYDSMNIGYLYGFNSYPPSSGGAVHVYNLIRNFHNLGCNVHTFDPEENPICVTYPGTNEGVQDFIDNIDLLYMRLDGWYLSRSWLKLKCLGLAAGSKPIVWEINSSSEERLQKKTFVQSSSVHFGLIDKFMKFRHDKKLQISISREELLRKSLAKKADAATCVSKELSQYVVKGLGITEFKVIPNGSDPTLFSPEKKSSDLFKDYDNKFKVIYIGDSRNPWQGFDIITKLAAKSRQERPDFLFVVLDNSPVEKKLEEDNILVFRRINYFDVPTFVASGDLCLCLYDDFQWSSYGFTLSPLKLFDYMASGKPVIGSRLGQIASVIEEGEDGLLTTNNTSAVFEKIIYFSENPDKAQQMGKSAREKAIRFYNWERAAKSTLEVFNQVLR